jgi:caa(3)-type oxidase subunit IV
MTKRRGLLDRLVWPALLVVAAVMEFAATVPPNRARNQRRRSDLLIWLVLLIVAAMEFGASFLPIPPGIRPILVLPAAIMAVLVALGYMRLLTAPQIARGFTIAGIFWLTVLLGLAMNDPLSRTIYAVAG